MTAEDQRIAAEWGLTLKRHCGQHGSAIGIYGGRFKLADYCVERRRLIVSGTEAKQESTLFDAIVAIGLMVSLGSKHLPSLLRVSDRQRQHE